MAKEQPFEVWFEPADTRRFAVLMSRIVVGLGTVCLLGGLVVYLSLSERIRSAEWEEDRVLVESLARPGDSADGFPEDLGDGRLALIVDQGPASDNGLRQRTVRSIPESIITDPALRDSENRLSGWIDAVTRMPSADGHSQFTSFDPSERTWWVTSAPLDDDSVLVVMRPASTAEQLVAGLGRFMAGLGLAVLVGLVLVWLALRARVLGSAQKLIDGAEDLRVRGEFRPSTRAALQAIPERPIEFKRLARSLDYIERDAQRNLEQIESLLLAAQTLGASLDSGDILENTLAQVETLLGVERSAILRFDARFESFTVLASRGHTPDFLAELRDRPAERDLPTVRCLAEQRPVQLPDTESVMANDAVRVRARRHGYRSLLAVPLPGNLESPSLLLIHKSEPYTYSHDEIELSVSFASIAAAALRNADLFARTDETLRSRSSQLEAIVESVDQGILVSSQSDVVVFANSTMQRLLDPGAWATSTGSVGSGMSHQVFVDSVLTNAADADGARAALERIGSGPEGWCDVDLHRPSIETVAPGRPVEAATYRVRSFHVTDDDGQRIGRGQVWTDVTDERALDKMKSGLLATISHEFRTPLALIKGYATTLLADDVDWGQAEQTEFLNLVNNEVDRLTGLVERLLDMRRIDAGMVELDLAPIDMWSLVDAALVGLPHLRHRIQVESSPAGRELLVDEARAVTVIRNLVENACRYSSPDDPVTIEWLEEDESTVISVIDRGPGIPESDRERIFHTFVRRGAVDGVPDPSGIGLGLAIARGFTEAHGGVLWAEPGPDGIGSRFNVRLPTERSAVSVA